MTDLALTLYAPWAWAVIFGAKDIENRTSGFQRHRGGKEVLGRIWVHAGLGPTSQTAFFRECEVMLETFWAARGWIDEFYDCRDRAIVNALLERTATETGLAKVNSTEFKTMRGHIIGSVEVTGYVWPDEPSDSPWRADGSLALQLANPVPLARPVPARGKQGWWEVSGDLLAALEGQKR